MLTQENVDTAYSTINPGYYYKPEDVILQLHKALTIITPNATFDFECYTNNNDMELVAVITFSFDDDPTNIHTFGITIKVGGGDGDADGTLLYAHIIEKDITMCCVSTKQVITLATTIHKVYIVPNDIYNQSFSLSGLTKFQKQLLIDFVRKNNLENL